MRFKRVYGNGRFSLGPFYMSDVKKVAKLAEEAPYGLEDEWGDPRDYFKFIAKYKDSLIFSCRDNKKIIGFITLNYIVENKDAFFGGFAYRKNFNGAVQCSKLAIYYGFERFNLRRVTAMHSEKNRAATLVDLRVGFKKEGLLRNAMVFKGELHSAILMGITREEVAKWQLEVQ